MKSIAHVVSTLMNGWSPESKLALSLTLYWEKIFGKFSSVTRFNALEEETLLISVHNAMILFELRMHESSLLERIHSLVAEGATIKALRFFAQTPRKTTALERKRTKRVLFDDTKDEKNNTNEEYIKNILHMLLEETRQK